MKNGDNPVSFYMVQNFLVSNTAMFNTVAGIRARTVFLRKFYCFNYHGYFPVALGVAGNLQASAAWLRTGRIP